MLSDKCRHTITEVIDLENSQNVREAVSLLAERFNTLSPAHQKALGVSLASSRGNGFIIDFESNTDSGDEPVDSSVLRMEALSRLLVVSDDEKLRRIPS